MADEEFKVEVELGSDEHGLSFWKKLRTLDLDDDARQRLGGRVIVTRHGNRMELYTPQLGRCTRSGTRSAAAGLR